MPNVYVVIDTGDFMKKVLLATWVLRDRKIVVIEWVYAESTFFMKSAVGGECLQ